MPNSFAYIALLLWPVVSIFLCIRYSGLVASFWSVLAGCLLLPEAMGIDLPYLPAYDKSVAAALPVFLFLFFFSKKRILLVPRIGAERLLFFIMILSPFLTTLVNREAIFNNYGMVRGLTLYDAFSHVISQYLILIPFLLGLRFMRTYQDQLRVFRWTCLACVLYSALMILEWRLSPQLHNWVYGFATHNFGQQFRYGSFRPVVFMGNGLNIAFLVSFSFCAAVSLAKLRKTLFGVNPNLVATYLFGVLILCKSMGAIVLALIFLAGVHLSVRKLRKLTLVFSVVLFLYPVVSLYSYALQDQLVRFVELIDIDRANSLSVRFESEKILVSHAAEKLSFGWGGWSRNRVGRAITDGYWVIVMGQVGLAGYFSLFGLILISIWKAAKGVRYSEFREEKMALVFLAFLVLILLTDQFVNSSLSSSGIYWFLIGGLIGRFNYLRFQYQNMRSAKHMQSEL